MIRALRHSQSLRCVTHKACVVSPTKPALPVSHWEGCLPRCGKGVFLGAGRVSSSRREGCLPRCGKGVFLGAGRVSCSRREGCLPRCGKGVFLEAGGVSSSRREGCLPRCGRGVFPRCGEMDSLRRAHVKTVFLTPNRPITPRKQGEHKAPTPLNFVDKAPTFGTPNHTLYIQQ